MARKIIGGLITSSPHNKNYTELYDKVGELDGKIENIEENAVNMSFAIYTATSDDISHIVHNLPYVPGRDVLQVVYMTLVLELGVNYIEGGDNISIDLLDWSINIGEKIYFKLYKNVK